MSIIAWVLLGLVAGFIASRYFSEDGSGLVSNVLIGIVGATISGYAFDAMVPARATSFLDMWSVLVSLTGAVALLGADRAIRKRQSGSG